MGQKMIGRIKYKGQRRVMCGNAAASGATPVCYLAARWATYGSYRFQPDGPFRRAKTGRSQM